MSMDIIKLQKAQLSRGAVDPSTLVTGADAPFLAEVSAFEGDLVPLVIRSGPLAHHAPGVVKKYEFIEINGQGIASVMVWINGRLVSQGTLFAQETPRSSRRLNIPRGLRNGYDIDIYIAFQGTFKSYEVFYDLVSE